MFIISYNAYTILQQELLIFTFYNKGNINTHIYTGFPGGSDGKEPACNAEDPASIPGSRRSPGEGNGNPFHYSCLENAMDKQAWQAIVHGVSESAMTEHFAFKVLRNWDTLAPRESSIRWDNTGTL